MVSEDFHKELEDLKVSVSELSILNKIATAINSTLSIDKINEIIVNSCLGHLNASQGAIFLLDDTSNKTSEFKTYVRKINEENEELPFHFHMSLAGWINKNKKILIINVNDNNQILKGLDFNHLGIRSLIAAPLLTKSKVMGALVFFNKENEDGFNQHDGNFLEILGSQCSQTIEAARLYIEEQKLLEFNKELQIAREIQQGFLPKIDSIDSIIDTKGLYGINIPAKNVSGDYFDIIHFEDGRIFLSIGDVSGKGLPASLLMSNANAILRSKILGEQNPSLTELADVFNKMIFQFSKPSQYITGLFGIYDTNSMVFSYVNAGHLPPIVIGKEEVTENEDSNLIFGFDPSTVYKSYSIKLTVDSVLILLTDGISEACDKNGTFYGDQNYIDIVKENLEKPANEICNAILNSINNFCCDVPQSDDITMIVLKS